MDAPSSDAPIVVRPEGPDAWCVISRDREEELRDVVRRVRRRAARTGGELRESVAVVFERRLPYLYLARQVFDEGGVPFQTLDALPLASSVSITRPAELAKELFTHRGSGTLVRRGERVLTATSWDELDTGRLRQLVESAFGRRLLPDYFARTRLHRAYVSENYRAAMIVTLEDGVPYLDKFAVLDEAQGEGLGRAVWLLMREQNPALFWRSRHGNPVNTFYYAESDGCIKQEKWKVYWYGDADFARIERYVQLCAQRPATLEEPA